MVKGNKKATKVPTVRIVTAPMKQRRSGKQKQNRGPKKMVTAGNASMLNAQKWLKLLADPCTGALAYPPYGGTDAGYLVKTVDYFNPGVSGTGLVSGNYYQCFGIWQYCPSNISSSTGYTYMFTTSGIGSSTAVTVNGTNTFITTSVVKQYRPVAACVRFVPTGSSATRAGEVGTGYSNGLVVVGGSSYSASSVLPLCLRTATNGSERHEVNWVPTIVDENFTTTNATGTVGGGTCFLLFNAVDGIATSSTAVALNGYIEATTIWEWVPASSNGIVADPRTPGSVTAQAALSMAGDIKRLLYAGASMGVSTGFNLLADAAHGLLRQNMPSVRTMGSGRAIAY